MKIDEIILREIEMRLRAPFETSFGTVRGRRIALMEVRCDGVSGWGEVTAAEGPFYNSETTDTAWTVLCKFIAPLVLGQNIRAASEVMRLLEPVNQGSDELAEHGPGRVGCQVHRSLGSRSKHPSGFRSDAAA